MESVAEVAESRSEYAAEELRETAEGALACSRLAAAEAAVGAAAAATGQPLSVSAEVPTLGTLAKYLSLIDGVMTLSDVVNPRVEELGLDVEAVDSSVPQTPYDDPPALSLVLRHYRNGIAAQLDSFVAKNDPAGAHPL